MVTSQLTVSYIQPNIYWKDKDRNLNMFDKIIGRLPDITDLIILPEMFSTGFIIKPASVAEEMNGKTVNWMSRAAMQKNAVVTGSVVIKEDNCYYNRLIWMKPVGKSEYYDKRHLFRMGEENEDYSTGDKKLITKLKQWRIRPLICYDLRFPVWSRNKNDYDILLYLANWPEARRKVWKNLLVARALENQAFVVGVNRVGIDGRNISYAGDSMIVDPKGNIVSKIEAYNESFETKTLLLSDLISFREKFPVHLDADDFRIIK